MKLQYTSSSFSRQNLVNCRAPTGTYMDGRKGRKGKTISHPSAKQQAKQQAAAHQVQPQRSPAYPLQLEFVWISPLDLGDEPVYFFLLGVVPGLGGVQRALVQAQQQLVVVEDLGQVLVHWEERVQEEEERGKRSRGQQSATSR